MQKTTKAVLHYCENNVEVLESLLVRQDITVETLPAEGESFYPSQTDLLAHCQDTMELETGSSAAAPRITNTSWEHLRHTGGLTAVGLVGLVGAASTGVSMYADSSSVLVGGLALGAAGATALWKQGIRRTGYNNRTQTIGVSRKDHGAQGCWNIITSFYEGAFDEDSFLASGMRRHLSYTAAMNLSNLKHLEGGPAELFALAEKKVLSSYVRTLANVTSSKETFATYGVKKAPAKPHDIQLCAIHILLEKGDSLQTIREYDMLALR